MQEPEPGTSKGLDLDAAKAEVESTITTQTVEADITVRNWNCLRGSPPPLSAYVSRLDDPKTVGKKAKWHAVKCQQTPFNFNQDLVKYCYNYVVVLLASVTRFILQCFQFGQEIVDRFGPGPTLNVSFPGS